MGKKLAGDEKPKPGSLTGKFMFIILGAMFALLGVLGVCGTVADNAGVGDTNLPMFFRVFSLVWFKVLPIILFVFFFLIGLLIFSIGVHEFARPFPKGKTTERGKRTVRLRRMPDLDIPKLFGGFLGCIAALGLIIGLKSFQLFTNPFAFKCFLIVSPVAVIGTYAAFVVRMVRREAALPHYKVTFTAPVGGNDSTSVGDSTAVGDSTIAIHRTIMRDAQYRMQRDYNLKGCKVNARNRAQGAYYGRKVRVKE